MTGIISTKTRLTAGSRQSMTTRSFPSRPRSHGIGQEHLDHGRDQDRERVHVELRVHRLRLRDADHEPDDDRDVPEDRRQRRNGEVLVAVEDPDDDPGDAEQRHDREQHAREADGERGVVARVAERPDHPRRDEDVERGQRREAEEHQPEERRRDAPGALLVLLQQLGEDRDERRRERGVRDERPEEVRELERDGEGVDLAAGAEVVRRDHLADEPEHAREARGDAEDRGRDGEPAPRRQRALFERRLVQRRLDVHRLGPKPVGPEHLRRRLLEVGAREARPGSSK